MPSTAIQYRLSIKVFGAILNFFVAIAVGILVPRAVGPKDYGELMYVIATVEFLMLLGTAQSHPAYIFFQSNGRFTPGRVNGTYFTVLGVGTAFVALLITLATGSSLFKDILWKGVSLEIIIYMGAVIGILSFWQNKLLAYADCQRFTLPSEISRFASRFCLLITVLVLFLIEKLSIINYLILWIFSLTLFFVFYFKYIDFEIDTFSWRKGTVVLRQMWIYLKPLIVFSMIAALYSYSGKYLLQQQAGSIEQGYYNFAFSLAMIPVTLLTSVMTIYMSEMTKLFTSGKSAMAGELFLRNIVKVFAFHSLIAFFLCAFAPEIILKLSGAEFLGAVPALQALAFFSLLHTFGTLSGNLFLSSGRNKSYSIINCVFMILGLVVFVVVYRFGNFNATSLSIMMTIFYGMRVFVQLYFNSVHLGFSFTLLVIRIIGLTLLIGGGALFVRQFNFSLFLSGFIYVITFLIISIIHNDVYGLLSLFSSLSHKYRS